MLEFDERFLTEANDQLAEAATEVSDLFCWWRSHKDGWRLAQNLGAIVGQVRICKNVFGSTWTHNVIRPMDEAEIDGPGQASRTYFDNVIHAVGENEYCDDSRDAL